MPRFAFGAGVRARLARAERHAALAQSVEHFTRNEKVESSILSGSSERAPHLVYQVRGPFFVGERVPGIRAPGGREWRCPCRPWTTRAPRRWFGSLFSGQWWTGRAHTPMEGRGSADGDLLVDPDDRRTRDADPSGKAGVSSERRRLTRPNRSTRVVENGHARKVSESLKVRVREKLLRQLAENGGHPVEEFEGDDPRLVAIDGDLAALDEVAEDDPLVEELAAKYWVP